MDQRTKSGPPPVFISKILLEHSLAPLFRCCLWLLEPFSGRAELWQRVYGLCRKYMLSVPLLNNFLTSEVEWIKIIALAKVKQYFCSDTMLSMTYRFVFWFVLAGPPPDTGRTSEIYQLLFWCGRVYAPCPSGCRPRIATPEVAV